MRTRDQLRGYQRRAVGFLRRRRYGALLIDMGLGKTVIALTAIVDMLRSGEIDNVLTVAPVRVIQGVWRQEALEWQHTRKLRFSLVHGTPAERLAALQRPAHVHLTNPEGLKWLTTVMKRRAWPWSMLIVDESTEFSAEKKTVRFRCLRKGLRFFKRRVTMTGTFTPRSLIQVWPQMFIADLGASLGQDFSTFKSNHFEKTGYMGYKLEPKEGSEETIAEAMAPRVVRLRAEDWIEVPKLVTVPIWVELPPHARELYDRFEEEMLEFDTGTVDGPEEVVAEMAASLSIKCRQIANGAIFTSNVETGARSWRPVHDAKIEALREIVHEAYDENFLIPYQFQHDAARVKSAFPKFSLFDKRRVEETIVEWNKGRIPGLTLHPANSKYGLNLQKGGNRLAWFGGTFSRLFYDQTIGRLRRSGQPRPSVYNYLILARNTVDEVVLEALEGHGARQTRISAAFQRYYEARLTRREV